MEEEMSAAEPRFDWVHVGGLHEAVDTFLDGERAWRLARSEKVLFSPLTIGIGMRNPTTVVVTQSEESMHSSTFM
jgi:hypothetical protein